MIYSRLGNWVSFAYQIELPKRNQFGEYFKTADDALADLHNVKIIAHGIARSLQQSVENKILLNGKDSKLIQMEVSDTMVDRAAVTATIYLAQMGEPQYYAPQEFIPTTSLTPWQKIKYFFKLKLWKTAVRRGKKL